LSKRIGRVHCVLPDGQVRPGVDLTHWKWISNYIAAKRPDVIVNIGDFADMVSLNSYQVGKADAEGTRYESDIKSARLAMSYLMRSFAGLRGYHPRLEFTLGNHEDRITREAQDNPRLIGTISVDDLGYKEHGWRVNDFLKIVNIDRVAYSHYFISGSMGRPVSSAAALLRTRQQSCVMGHVQRIDLAVHPFTQNIALFSGICYTHDENYLTPQGNNTKRGIWMLNEVADGTFDPMFVSLNYLRRNYAR